MIFDRLKAYYQDQNIRYDVVEAVLVCKPMVLTDLNNRVMAVSEFLDDEAAVALAAANKRISNILKKQQQAVATEVNQALLQEAAEQRLYQHLCRIETIALAHFDGNEYLFGLRALASLREDVDSFFDDVMVMVEDQQLQMNRLALLQKLANNFLRVAECRTDCFVFFRWCNQKQKTASPGTKQFASLRTCPACRFIPLVDACIADAATDGTL